MSHSRFTRHCTAAPRCGSTSWACRRRCTRSSARSTRTTAARSITRRERERARVRAWCASAVRPPSLACHPLDTMRGVVAPLSYRPTWSPSPSLAGVCGCSARRRPGRLVHVKKQKQQDGARGDDEQTIRELLPPRTREPTTVHDDDPPSSPAAAAPRCANVRGLSKGKGSSSRRRSRDGLMMIAGGRLNRSKRRRSLSPQSAATVPCPRLPRTARSCRALMNVLGPLSSSACRVVVSCAVRWVVLE